MVPEPVPWGKSAISSAVLGMDQDNGLCGLLSLEVGGASSLRLGIVLLNLMVFAKDHFGFKRGLN